MYGQILTLTKCFPTYLLYLGPWIYKYIEKHFVKVKIWPYIYTLLNRFLEAIRGQLIDNV